MTKARVATVWLDGCSGCHMSILDMDERMLPVFDSIDLVYSPLVDIKEFPESVDITLVEGAISNEEDLHKINLIRARTKILVALGDCAITGNVSAMRNSFDTQSVMERAYIENATEQIQIPQEQVPPLLKKVCPLHEVVKVDLHIPGCPPSADIIHFVLSEFLQGRVPDVSTISKFG